MNSIEKKRRITAVVALLFFALVALVSQPDMYEVRPTPPSSSTSPQGMHAESALQELAVKGRAPKTGYARTQFGDGWSRIGDCDTRNTILHRDLRDTVVNDACQVVRGVLDDPYTGKKIDFVRGETTSSGVQIDHVVALSDAWQKGAKQLSQQQRIALANDPLELLAVDGPANQDKSDSDAATWLPPNKAFRCQYVARQIAVKKKYQLWVTSAEKEAMLRVLSACPGQTLLSK